MYIGPPILLVSLQFDHSGFISVKGTVPNKHYRYYFEVLVSLGDLGIQVGQYYTFLEINCHEINSKE